MAGDGGRLRVRGGDVRFLDSRCAGLLMGDERAVDRIGKPDAPGFGEALGVFLGQERAPNPGGLTTAKRSFAVNVGEHVFKHRAKKAGFEVLSGSPGSGIDLLAAGGIRRRCNAPRGALGHGKALREAHGYMVSMSAWIAPAALIAWRMAIRSRGPIPSAFNPSTTCCSETPSETIASFLPSSCTPTRVRGTTRVCPRASGGGWLTCGVSLIVTVRLPCATATVETRTSRPMTITPERSSITIRAARSGSTCSCSISVRKATTLPLNSDGMDNCTVEGSIGSAVFTPR